MAERGVGLEWREWNWWNWWMWGVEEWWWTDEMGTRNKVSVTMLMMTLQ